MTAVRWYGVSKQKPASRRYRTADGWFGFEITCWHGKKIDYIYPDRATVESWEYEATLRPCPWVNCAKEGT